VNPDTRRRNPIAKRPKPVPQATPVGELAVLLDGFLRRDTRSLNRIALNALVDVGYLWRLQHGQQENPSRDLLIRLALALHLEPEELDELLVATDYAPITLRRS